MARAWLVPLAVSYTNQFETFFVGKFKVGAHASAEAAMTQMLESMMDALVANTNVIETPL